MHRNKELTLLATSDLTWRGTLAYLRARWSISSWSSGRGRAHSGEYIVDWKSGEQVALRAGTSDVLVFRELFLERVYDQPLEALAINPTRPRILDCGANVGFFPVLCARTFRNPSLLCVEPETGNFEAMRENTNDTPAEVKYVRAFLGANRRLGYLEDCGGGEWAFRLSHNPAGGAEADPIPVLDVPSLLECAAWNEVDLLKIDIEGGEAEVFANCSGWIRSVRSMIVETHPPYSIDQLTSDLSRSDAMWKVRFSATNGHQAVCALSRSA